MSPRLFKKTGQIWLNFWGKFILRFGKIRFRRKILMEGPSFYNEVFSEKLMLLLHLLLSVIFAKKEELYISWQWYPSTL